MLIEFPVNALLCSLFRAPAEGEQLMEITDATVLTKAQQVSLDLVQSMFKWDFICSPKNREQ